MVGNSQDLAVHSFPYREQEPGTTGEAIRLFGNRRSPDVDWPERPGARGTGHGQRSCFTSSSHSASCLLLTFFAQGLSPVTASSWECQRGALGVQWGSPSAEGTWPFIGMASAYYRRRDAAGTSRAEPGVQMAAQSSSWLEARPQTGNSERGPLTGCLGQDKVTLACHTALNAGSVRCTSRAWVSGEGDAACQAGGLSPDSLRKCPWRSGVCAGGHTGVLSAGLSLFLESIV